MANDGRDTPEYKAFKSCTSMVINTIKYDQSIVDKSFGEGLISEETHGYYRTQSYERANRVVSNLREKIELDAKNFNVFCDILKENGPYCADLLSKLQSKFFTYSYIKFN